MPCFLSTPPRAPRSPLFPYTTLFRSEARVLRFGCLRRAPICPHRLRNSMPDLRRCNGLNRRCRPTVRSEEHTSELQSHSELVCRLLLEKKMTAYMPNVGRYGLDMMYR